MIFIKMPLFSSLFSLNLGSTICREFMISFFRAAMAMATNAESVRPATAFSSPGPKGMGGFKYQPWGWLINGGGWYMMISKTLGQKVWILLAITDFYPAVFFLFFVFLWRWSCDLWSDREWIWEVITEYWYWKHISWRADQNINVDIRFIGEKQGFVSPTRTLSRWCSELPKVRVFVQNLLGFSYQLHGWKGENRPEIPHLPSNLLYFILGKYSTKWNYGWISPRWRYPYNPGGYCTQTIEHIWAT